MERKKVVMHRYGKIEEMDRSFDIEYWQRLGPQAIFAAAFRMVIDHYAWKTGQDGSTLRLQRTVGSLQRQ